MSLVIAILLIGVAFYLLALISEEFFVPSIDRIAERLKLSHEAAGATLLAAGSSAPEFFTSLFAILGSSHAEGSDIGAGTIVGSAIFNILVIVGASAMFKSVTLNWKPVIRDQLFYIFTILMLLWAFMDGKITLAEALSFIAMYVVYVFIVVNWRKWLKYKDVVVEMAPDVDDAHNKLHVLSHKVVAMVIPDPKRKPKLQTVTFILSVLSIAGLSWVLVEQVIVIAEITHINPTFLALTLLAAGTSLPDLIGSIIVAKQGRGDMAVSNAVGSNIFDILFALGLPWTIYILINSNDVKVSNDNLGASILLLFATVVSILFLLIVRRWKLGRYSGLALIILYAAYCVFTIATVA